MRFAGYATSAPSNSAVTGTSISSSGAYIWLPMTSSPGLPLGRVANRKLNGPGRIERDEPDDPRHVDTVKVRRCAGVKAAGLHFS